MSCARRSLASIGLWLLLAPVQAQEDWTNSTESYLCKSSAEVREVRTYWREASPEHPGELSCRVDYVRAGAIQTVWSAHRGRAYCDAKASELVAKLTAGGQFSCERLRLGSR